MDEQEEQQRISIEDRILQERMRRLDELANNMSSSRIDEYHAQVAAQGEQIQRDREMAATLAADYEGQITNEKQKRRNQMIMNTMILEGSLLWSFLHLLCHQHVHCHHLLWHQNMINLEGFLLWSFLLLLCNLHWHLCGFNLLMYNHMSHLHLLCHLFLLLDMCI